MTENSATRSGEWTDPDDAPEWTEEMFAMAEHSVGGVVVREATGVLTRDGMRPIGRPPLGEKARKPVTMRLPPHVLAYFRGTGPGWQRRVAEVLERFVAEHGDPNPKPNA
nr:BrnA antitoxin family protein [Polymorphobacter sp.]